MTATRIGRLATLVVFCGLWLVAAALLWRTSVPTNLRLSGADVHRLFPPAEVARAARYERFLYVLWGSHLVATVVALVVLSIRAPRLARTIGLGRIGTGVIVGMLILVTLWFVSLPFGFAAQWWAARYGLAPSDYLAWLFAPWAQLSFEAFFALALIVIVMALAGRLGERWWLVGAPVFAAIALAFGFLGGYLAGFGTHAVKSPSLRAAVRTLEQKEHVPRTPVTVEKVGKVTNEVNAFTVGFGPSSRVVLWDTLLDGRLTPGEVRFVVAHELGHVAHRHVLKAVGWSLLLFLPLAWLVTRVARRRGGLGERRVAAARIPGARRRQLRVRAAGERGVAALRGRGRLVGPARDARHGVGAQALRRLRAHEPRSSRARRCGRTSGSRTIRRSPSASRWSRSSLGLVGLGALRRGFRQVPDPLGGRPFRPRVLHRVQEVAHELVRDVDARHDDTRDVAVLDLVVDARERDREFVLGEADVREIRVDAAHRLGIDVNVQLALPGLLVHAPTIAP